MPRNKALVDPKPGPEPVEIDYKIVEQIAQIGGTWGDVATVVGITERQLRNRRALDPKIDQHYRFGMGNCIKSLRAKQFQRAMAGSDTMLIWLGKNLLNQTDRMDSRRLEVHASVGSIDLEELAGMSNEELMERLEILEAIKDRTDEDVIDVDHTPAE